MSTTSELLTNVIRPFLQGLSPDQTVDPETPLISLGLDSLKAIDLLFSVEEHFNIQFPDHMLNGDTFATQRALSNAVESLLAANPQ